MAKIFVIEDDESIRELVKVALQGYGHEVFDFECAEDALEELKHTKADLGIFDIMLPGMDGVEAVKEYRSTETNGHMAIISLDSGADDYVTKPFSVMELMARVRAQLRRYEQPVSNKISLGTISINTDTREVFVNGEEVKLTFKEYELLVFLIENGNKVVSRDELLNKIWGYEYTGETRTIDIHIKTLRQKLGTAGDYIKTIRGMGYRAVKE